MNTHSLYITLRNLCFVLSMTALVDCTGNDASQREAQNDTLHYLTEAMEALTSQTPERALAIIDSAERVGSTGGLQATLARARICSHIESQRVTARTLCVQLLRQDNLTEEQRFEVLEVLVYVARMRQDDEGVLNYGMQYLETCHRQGEEIQALLMQSEMGEALIRLGRTDEGFVKMDDAIAQLDPLRRFAGMDACIRALKRKINSLFDLKRYDEAIPLAERIVEKLNDYGEHPTDYADGTNRLPSDDRRPGYIDFYSGQAYAFMAYAYAMLSNNQNTPSTQNNPNTLKAQAKRCLALFDKTDYSKMLNGKKLISSTWCQLGMYDKMLAFYDELQRQWGADTLHSDYAVMLRNRATAARARGSYLLSDAYLQRYIALQQHLNDSERLATAQECAARYHEQEQQLALEQEQAARKHMGSLAVFLGIIVLIAAAFIVFILRQSLSIRKKNAVLSKEISERIDYEEKYIASKQNTENPNIRTSDNPEIRTSEIASLSDSELFDYIRKIVSEENLHLDPQFGRDQLVERLQLSKERIGAAFAQGSSYGNISNFLNDARLYHSTKLLSEYPEMPINEVAAASGFANRVTFSRNFKERFAMTPSEFRVKN